MSCREKLSAMKFERTCRLEYCCGNYMPSTWIHIEKRSNNIYLSLRITASLSQGPAVSTVGRITPTPTGPGLSLQAGELGMHEASISAARVASRLCMQYGMSK